MGWWIALGVIFLLGILPLGISARYSGEGPLLRVVIGPVRLTLFPRKKKEKKHESGEKTVFGGLYKTTGWCQSIGDSNCGMVSYLAIIMATTYKRGGVAVCF